MEQGYPQVSSVPDMVEGTNEKVPHQTSGIGVVRMSPGQKRFK